MPKTTIEFSETAIAQLDQLATVLHATKAEILRNALSLYAYIVPQLQGQEKALGIVNEANGGSRIEKLFVVPGVHAAMGSRHVD